VTSEVILSPVLHGRALSPVGNLVKEKGAVVAPQMFKHIVPHDPRGFLSAPPSPTGTIRYLTHLSSECITIFEVLIVFAM